MSPRYLNNHLKTFRQKWGLTQGELAGLIGVSGTTMSRYESGERRLPVPRLIACEILFGVRAVDLLSAQANEAEDDLSIRALALYEKLEGKADPGSNKKRRLLSSMTARLHQFTV